MNSAYPLSDQGLIIYLFHGVVNTIEAGIRNYIRKHISKDYFYTFLKDKKERGLPMSMDQVLSHLKQGKKFPANSFAITFDDGFENNLSIAAPILEELALPATFYVTTRYIDKNEMSWIDRIEYCLACVPKGKIKLPWQPDIYKFENDTDKIRILIEIRARIKTDASINVNQFVANIFKQCAVEEIWQMDDELNLKMNWDKVKKLNAHSLFTVAGHSHTHTILSFLSGRALQQEIEESIRLLRQKANISSVHYAYPEGLAHHYNAEVIEILKGQGIECCPSAIAGVNKVACDPFHLHRTMVMCDA